MKKILSLILSIVLLLSAGALAEQVQTVSELNYTENVTYWGDGVFRIGLMRDVAWRTDYVLTATDAFGTAQSVNALGGDANDIYVQIDGEVPADALYTFSLVSDSGVIYAVGVSTIGVEYHNYCEYCLGFGHADDACVLRGTDGAKGDADRCDLCGELGHEEDYCPTRTAGTLYCDECGQYGHDDDYCPYDDDDRDDDWDERCDYCGAYGHDDERCPERRAASTPASANNGETSSAAVRREYCDECRQYGHDDDDCPNERCDECGRYGHDDDRCPNERCDECGEYGHDDDRCPNERCDECGEYGHDDDRCPNERCDECGKTGHDDDDCPNERCDECGRYGHDDDRCPYDRD